SFEPMWHMTPASSWALEGSGRAVAIAIELFFPLVAIALLAWDYTQRRRVAFSLTAAVMPLVTALAWMIANLAPATKRTQDTSYFVRHCCVAPNQRSRFGDLESTSNV